MKKRIVTLLLCAVLALSLTATALADVIYEPSDDFYFSHLAECGHVNRTFFANGPGGGAEYCVKPGGRASGSFENGQEVYVSASYADKSGADWGYAEIFDAREGGWVRLDDLLLKYDSQSFAEEFDSQIRDSGDRSLDIRETGAVFWTYPESGEAAVTWGPGEGPDPGEPLPISLVWTDEAGREWGLVSYFYGIRGRWVCLDDPANGDIAAVSRQELPDWGGASVNAPADPSASESPKSSAEPSPSPDVTADPEPPASRALPYVLVAVGLVVVAAVVLLQVISQRRKKAK